MRGHYRASDDKKKARITITLPVEVEQQLRRLAAQRGTGSRRSPGPGSWKSSPRPMGLSAKVANSAHYKGRALSGTMTGLCD